MSSHSIHTQSNSARDATRPPDGRQDGAAMTIFDQTMVTAMVSAIAYIVAIMTGWL